MWFSHPFRDCRTNEKIENLAFNWSRIGCRFRRQLYYHDCSGTESRSHHKGATGRVIWTVRSKQAKSETRKGTRESTGSRKPT